MIHGNQGEAEASVIDPEEILTRRATEVDAAVLQRAQRGDHDAFHAIVDAYEERLRVLAYHLLRDAEQMNDALQDTLQLLTCGPQVALRLELVDRLAVRLRKLPQVADAAEPGGRDADRTRDAERAESRFDARHALLVGAILAHPDFLDEQIELLSEAIGAALAPFAAALELLCSIPGVQRRTAENVLAEIGLDMSRFPTAGHLASWAGQCPGNHESAGKRRSGRTRKGSKWLNEALTEAAMAATRTNGSYLQALYRRLRPRLGHGRALGAVKHSMLCACWEMLSSGELYRDPGGDYFARRDPERQTKRLVRQLEALGHTVILEEAAA